MTFTEALIKAIEASTETRYAIAVGSGVDHAVLRRFMRRERDIKLQTADKLASYLGIKTTLLRAKRKRKV